MVLRPVAVRTSFSAASTASVPVGPQNWIFASAASAGGSRPNRSWTNWSFTGVVRSRVCSGSSSARTWRIASITTGWLCPSARVPAPARQSMKVRPSTSSTSSPLAFFSASGIRRG